MKFVLTAWIPQLWASYDGQDMIEYALIAGFFAILAAASIPSAVAAVNQAFAAIIADLNALAATVSTS